MTFFRTAGLVRSARNWGALGATLALLVGLSTLAGVGFTGGATSLALQGPQPVPEAYFNQSPPNPDVPSEVLIGEQFKFKVRFKNTGTLGTDIGYAPFIDLAIDSRGADNNAPDPNLPNNPLPCDGINFVSAEMVAVNPPLTLTNINLTHPVPTACTTFSGPINVNHPFANNGVPPVTFPDNGWQLVTIELPFPNYDPTQPNGNRPEIVVEVTAQVHPFADVNVPLQICTRGGFRFGTDPLDNPSADPPILQHGNIVMNLVDPWQCEPVTPTVFTLKKEYIGPESETATGPNFPHKYKITVDIADGQIIDGLQINDTLPGNLQFNQLPLPTPGNVTVMVLNPAISTTISTAMTCVSSSDPVAFVPPIPGPGPGGILGIEFCVPVKGTSQSNDIVITFEFYIPDKDASGDGIIKIDCNNAPVDVINDIKATGAWAPFDPRDLPTPQQVASTFHTMLGDASYLQAKCLAIEKSVKNYTHPSAQDAIPGDILEYTFTFQISDYFTIGELKVEDLLANGQDFLTPNTSPPTPALPMLTVQDQFGTTSGSFTLGGVGTDLTAMPDPTKTCTAGKPPLLQTVTGVTTLQFDVAMAMQNLNGPPGGIPRHFAGILTGGYAAGLTPPSTTPATGTIVFYAQIRDDFQFSVPGDKSVDKDDPMNNCVTIRGMVYENVDRPNPINDPSNIPSAIIGSTQDTSASQINIATGILQKSVYAVKRGTQFVCAPASISSQQGPCPAKPQVTPGDQVTFRLEYTIPSGDAENLTIQDWLPLPIFDVTSPPITFAATPCPSTATAIPVPGSAGCGPNHTAPVNSAATVFQAPSFAPQPGNSIEFTYGTIFDTSNTVKTIDLLFTLTVTNTPFADGLFLTNEAQECEDNTFGTMFCQVAVAQVQVAEPNVRIMKGIVATDNQNGMFSPLPIGPVPFSPPGSSFPRFTGTINSSGLAAFPINSDLTNVDANDLVTFAIVVENLGSGPNGAFDVKIRDIFPLGPTDIPTCFDPDLNTLHVTDGTGNPILFTLTPGGFGSFVIELTDPSLTQGALASYDPANGKNIAVITFDAKLVKDIKSGCCDNRAKLENYSNTEGGPNFVTAGFGGPFEDTAKVCVGPRAYAKCIQTTSEVHTIPQSGNTVDATIGEIVRYRLITVIAEGTTLGFQVQDLLPVGLTYVGNPKAIFVADTPVTNPLGIGTVKGQVSCPGKPSPTDPITISPSTFPFGTGTDPNFPGSPITITNNDNDPDLEFVIIEFNAQVDNINAPPPGNQDGVVLTNQFEVHYQDEAGNAFTSTSGPVDVKIVEPNLTLTKTASPTTVTQGGTVTYTVTITNTGTATAFDVRFTDTLPTGFTPGAISLPAFPAGCIGFTTGGLNVGVTCISPGFSGIPVNGAVTITYEATVSPTVPCNTTLTNTAKVTWTSLPGDNGTTSNPTGSSTVGNPGAFDGERDGVTAPLTLNDYAATDSVPLTVTCDNCATPPPSMVSWWPLDDPAGALNAIDIWDGNNGTVLNAAGVPIAIGGALAPAGQYVGNSLYFLGGYVKVSNVNTASPAGNLNFGTTGNFSIDAWIHIVTIPNLTTVPIVSKYAGAAGGYAFYLQNGNLMLTIGSSIFASGTAGIAAPGWYHVAVTVNRAAAIGTFYLNGAPVGPGFAPPPILSATSAVDLWIGKNHPPLPQNIEFGLDEVEIFNKALTLDQVKEIFQADKLGKCKSDLGDAPDSTNHANAQMLAYPSTSTVAHFPTVYDQATGTPPGPLHFNAKGDAWLGKDVTFEGEADKGWDQDGVGNNNIQPPSTDNKDDKDDGVILSTVILPAAGCSPMQFQYTVNVVGPSKLRYVNVWFDFNEDGDWQDTIPCGPIASTSEWAVQNQMFNMGAGFYTFTTPTFVAFRDPTKPPQMWMRITLTDVPVAPAQGADGSGPAGGYKFGETEDYLLDLKPGKAEICVTKFNDLNGNGRQDPDEPPLFGWKFDIKDNAGNLIGTVITGDLKPACLTVAAPGTYTITEQVQAGWTPTTPNPQTVTVQPGQTVNLSFGNKQEGKCDLVIGKSPTRGTTIPLTTGQQVTFEILVTNQGNGTCLAPLSVTDSFSAGLTYLSGGTSGWVCPTTPIGGPSSVTCNNNNLALAPSQSSLLLITFHVNVTAPPPTVIRNCAVVKNQNDSNDKNNEACIEVPVVPKAVCDLMMEKKVIPNPVQSGQQVTIILGVTNVGNVPCGPDTVVQDPKPTGLTFNPIGTGVTPSALWSCNFPGGNFSCVTASTMYPGFLVQFSFTATVTAPTGSSVQNCATVSNPNDSNPANNQSCVTTAVVPGAGGRCDLAINKEVKPNPLISGQPATYFITVFNIGNGICNPTITVTDTLAPGLVFSAAGGPGVVCVPVGQTVTCTSNNPLNPGQSLQIQINVTVRIDPGKEVRNCATVKNPNDVNLSNNEACITTVVQKK